MPARRPALSPTLRLTLVDDGMIVYDTATGALHQLKATAAVLLTLCDGRQTVEAITAAVRHGVAPAPGAEIEAAALEGWFDAAVRAGLVVGEAPAPSRPPTITACVTSSTLRRPPPRGADGRG